MDNARYGKDICHKMAIVPRTIDWRLGKARHNFGLTSTNWQHRCVNCGKFGKAFDTKRMKLRQQSDVSEGNVAS